MRGIACWCQLLLNRRDLSAKGSPTFGCGYAAMGCCSPNMMSPLARLEIKGGLKLKMRKKNVTAINRLPTFLGLFCLCCVICFANGCNRAKVHGLVPAEGVLLYEEKPLAWTIISFVPENAVGNARLGTTQTDGQGRFVLRTLGDQGVLPGNYKITATKYIADNGKDSVTEWKRKRQEPGFEEPQPTENILKVVSAIPEKFATTKNSGLTCTIEEKGNRDIVIELK
jgi:hypothetical protein